MFWLWVAFIWGACVGALTVSYLIRRDIRKLRGTDFKLGRKG